jgi:hypothetical protein
MDKGTLDQDKPAPHPGMMAATALRAIDACLRALRRLRRRFEVPAAEDDPVNVGSTEAEPTFGTPRQKPLLHRALIVLLCLLIGSGVGAWLSYRRLAKMLDSRGTVIEQMQEELDLSKKEETRNANLTAKFQNENSNFRLQMREAQREVDEYKSRIEELNKQLTAMKRVEPAAAKPSPVVAAKAKPSARPSAPQKTATCAVGTANLSGNLADCIDKFNKP